MGQALVEALRHRIEQVEEEQSAAWEKMPAAFNVENEDILGRFFDDVKALARETPVINDRIAELIVEVATLAHKYQNPHLYRCRDALVEAQHQEEEAARWARQR